MRDFSIYKYAVDPTTGSGLTWFTAVNTIGLRGVSISLRKVSGTVNGQFKVQTADFGEDQNHLPAAGDWVDYPGAVYPAATGAFTGTSQWQLYSLTSKWIRVVFTDGSSSTPLIDYTVTGRALTSS